ncbi:MAG TPA: sigma-54 dependent transcriptional regulator [Steroidobacteraceae bacterium]|jgi:two-component system response regulator FlrC|nr:sigma-54 dependent transcriptional regulator [Steroidobacteraceae bacterium]
MSKLSDAVLVVEDDAALREALLDTLRAAGLAALEAADAQAALTLLSSEDIGLVISDVHMPGANGYELLSSIKRMRPYLPVVLMTAYGTVSQAVAAMRDGATDYIVKPFDAQALIAMARRQLAARVTPNELIAVDPESKRLVGLARKIAENDATVLITGESGTGKEVYARFIRDNSQRADKPFVAINCAAIPENMLEASLFGHEKGAFTGALASHAGKFEQAQGGTLLLDEISEMDLGLQAKILRVLQEREVERLGSTRTIALDVRVIATSNRDLPEEVRTARFRADLFYRLNVMSLRLPALRERRGDILPLARRAMQACARPGQAALSLSPDAERKLLSHDWPGNARELNNIVQRAAWLAAGGSIDAADLDTGAAAVTHEGNPSIAGNPTMPGNATTAGEPSTAASIAAQDMGLDRDLKDRERELILATLRVTGGNRKLTAERLGISPRTLRHKLQQFKAAGVNVPLHQQFMTV